MIALVRKVLLCSVLLLMVIPAYAQTPIPMPDFVLAAARAVNARYGNIIDVNRVGWNYRHYSISGNDLNKLCPNMDATRPPFPSGTTTFTIVTFNTPETWRYLVYEKQTYFGPCELRAPGTAIPVIPSFTPIKSLTPTPTLTPTITPTPTITLTPSLTWTPSLTPTITLTPSPTLTIAPTLTPTPTLTVTPSPTFTITPSPTLTLTPTLTVTPSLTPTPSGCFGLPSRLVIGQPGRVTPGEANNLRDTPNARANKLAEIPGGGVFMVLDGPRCSLDGTWWQVNYLGTIGWTLEGRETVYYTEPATVEMLQATLTPTPTAAPVIVPNTIICDPALPPRLRIGESARVTPGGSANNVRVAEGRSSQYVGEIPPGGVFTVLEGPRCTGDGAWWRVDYNGLQGWTIEGMEGSYWLEPLAASFQPINGANLAQIQPLPNGQLQVVEPGVYSALRTITNEAVIDIEAGGKLTRWQPSNPLAPTNQLLWQPNLILENSNQWFAVPLQNTYWQARITDSSLQLFNQFNELWLENPYAFDSRTAFSPDGQWWAWTFNNQFSVARLDRVQPDFGQARALPNPANAPIAYLLFSADARSLVSVHDAGNNQAAIYLWDTTTWQARFIQQIAINPDGNTALGFRFIEIALSPDNRWLAFSLSEGDKVNDTIYLVELLENGQHTQITSTYADFVSALVFVDGSTLLAGGGITASQQGVLVSYPLMGGVETLLRNDLGTMVNELKFAPNNRILVISYRNAQQQQQIQVWGIGQ